MGRHSSVAPLHDLVAHTPSADAFPTCRVVVATVAGTITGIMADGRTVTAAPVVVGVNPYQMTKITAATATGLFLGY